MDILKIIFEHDLTLEHLSGHEDPRNRENDGASSLESFLRPQPTYNRYYFTGTRMPEAQFGFTGLTAYPGLLDRLDHILQNHMLELATSGESPASGSDDQKPGWYQPDGTIHDTFSAAAASLQTHDILVGGDKPDDTNLKALIMDDQTGIRERFAPLTALLDRNHLVLITEKAHHGIDFHLFSRHNLYESIFSEFQQTIGPELRYFSINGKRVSSERHFYFETWTLDRPPHGFQEVTTEARLR